jgi:hypothetical protein
LLTSTAISQSPLVDRRIEETGAGLLALYTKSLHYISEANAVTIVEYIAPLKSEVNLSDHYRKDVIEDLVDHSVTVL